MSILRCQIDVLRCWGFATHGVLYAAAGCAAGLLALTALVGACAGDAEPLISKREASRASSAPTMHAESPSRSASNGLVYVVPDAKDPRRLDLWRARLSDGRVQPFIQTPDRREELPSWSARAAALVFQTGSPFSWRVPPRLVLWQAGRERALPGARASTETEPVWAPFSTRLAYVFKRLQPAGGGGAIRSGVASINVQTGEQTILARDRRARYSRPAFSPDARLVVAEYVAQPGGVTRIARLDANGEPQLLTGAAYHASAPSFTRDGQYIVFIKRTGSGEPGDVLWIRPDGTGLEPIADGAQSDEFGATPSPVRDEIAFISDRDGKPDLFFVRERERAPRNLTSSLDVDVRMARWSPDGQHLALTVIPRVMDQTKGNRSRQGLAHARLLVIDRQGRSVLEARGFAADWMPPWE